MVVYVVVTSFLRNVAFLIYALLGEISILEIPVVGNFSLFAGLPGGPQQFPDSASCRCKSSDDEQQDYAHVRPLVRCLARTLGHRGGSQGSPVVKPHGEVVK